MLDKPPENTLPVCDASFLDQINNYLLVGQVSLWTDAAFWKMPLKDFGLLILGKPYQIVIASQREGEYAYTYTVTWKKPNTGGLPLTEYEFRLRKVRFQWINNEWMNFITYISPVKPEGQAQGCILQLSIVNPLGNDSPVRM